MKADRGKIAFLVAAEIGLILFVIWLVHSHVKLTQKLGINGSLPLPSASSVESLTLLSPAPPAPLGPETAAIQTDGTCAEGYTLATDPSGNSLCVRDDYLAAWNDSQDMSGANLA